MNIRPPRRTHFSLFASLLVFCALFPVASASAQRESLTPEEIELVRNNQELDKRIAVFVKAIERRVAAMGGTPQQPQQPAAVTAPTSKKAQKEALKDAEKMGALPESTRAQLLSDVARIYDEAITNIEDAGLRSEKSPLVPKALRLLADASTRLLPQLTALRETVAEGNERDVLERAIESAGQIVEAAKNLPEDTKEQKAEGKKQ